MLLAARMEYLLAVGGETTKAVLLGPKRRLTPTQVAKLCKETPAFISATLKELEAGWTDAGIDLPDIEKQ